MSAFWDKWHRSFQKRKLALRSCLRRIPFVAETEKRKVFDRITDAGAARRAIGRLTSEEQARIDLTVGCPDNDAIERVEGAGELTDGWITTHIGLEVAALGYYGTFGLNLLKANGGLHEPQEERAFQATLPFFKPGGTMLELGAFWGFYSLWFASQVPGARCFLVEPIYTNLLSGQINFEHNGLKAEFTQALVSSQEGKKFFMNEGTVDVISVDGWMKANGISQLNLLHADIQGFETAMLDGAQHALAARKIDYFYISTHPDHEPDCHEACLEKLGEHGYRVLVEFPPGESYSVDGLIVACSPDLESYPQLEVSRNSSAH